MAFSGAFICFQTMWRSGGTYVWSQTRRDPSTLALFEPCSEWLSAPSADAIDAAMTRSGMVFRHDGDRRYFVDYPFAPTGGVTYFQVRFSYDRYWLATTEQDPELKAYVGHLISYARDRQRRVVAKCCRWGLRSSWLLTTFDARLIYVVRDVDAMFRSYWSFGGMNSYFVLGSLLIFARNRQVEAFRTVATALDLPEAGGETVFDQLASLRAAVGQLHPQDIRDALLTLWAANLAHNMVTAHHVLDIDLLVESAEYRQRAGATLTEALGITLSFEDVRRTSLPVAPGRPVSDRGLAWAAAVVRDILDGASPAPVELSAPSARLISAVLNAR